MSSDYVIVLINLCPEVGNAEFIILCCFGGLSMSCFQFAEGGLGGPLVAEAKFGWSE